MTKSYIWMVFQTKYCQEWEVVDYIPPAQLGLIRGFFCYEYSFICHLVNLCYVLSISQRPLAEELLIFHLLFINCYEIANDTQWQLEEIHGSKKMTNGDKSDIVQSFKNKTHQYQSTQYCLQKNYLPTTKIPTYNKRGLPGANVFYINRQNNCI